MKETLALIQMPNLAPAALILGEWNVKESLLELDLREIDSHQMGYFCTQTLQPARMVIEIF